MRLLWLCNMMPGAVKETVTGKPGNGLWLDHVLQDLRRQQGLTIRILFPNPDAVGGMLDEACSYQGFRTKLPHQYLTELESWFEKELQRFQPDVIHSWGVEYAHTLAMVNAAEQTGYLNKMAISIQGLCGYIAGHYCEGLPWAVQHGFTFRDFLRQDNICQQKKKFLLRGRLERQALKKVNHIIGRTQWDRACTQEINPAASYHHCNETLRDSFYTGQWQLNGCKKHSIFTSSCAYPVKGFHHMLEAFAMVLQQYPDAELMVPGKSYLTVSPLRKNSYQRYLTGLTKRYGLESKIHFLGSLDAEGMKQAYLRANVFALPSTCENSPNSLGEAMLLGVPCVAADVGGVSAMMVHENEGFVYQSTAPYLLAYYLKRVFSEEMNGEKMGAAARQHGQRIHAPEENLRTLLEIYSIIKG